MQKLADNMHTEVAAWIEDLTALRKLIFETH